MTHELLKRKDMVKKTVYHPREPTVYVFFIIEELLDLAVISGTSYTQNQVINIASVIIQSTGKFSLVIRKWNSMPIVQKTWVGFW